LIDCPSDQLDMDQYRVPPSTSSPPWSRSVLDNRRIILTLIIALGQQFYR